MRKRYAVVRCEDDVYRLAKENQAELDRQIVEEDLPDNILTFAYEYASIPVIQYGLTNRKSCVREGCIFGLFKQDAYGLLQAHRLIEPDNILCDIIDELLNFEEERDGARAVESSTVL